jgi:hypothetical protein
MKHPYAYYLREYLDFISGHYAETTLDVRRRRLKQLKVIFYDLHDQNKVSTISPKLFTPDDIALIIG